MDRKQLEALRKRVRKKLAKHRRRRNFVRPEVNYDEVNAISDFLDASAQNPEEWS